MYSGPHNKQADLSFGIDLGTPDSNSGFRNKSRFFKGRPTTNLGPVDFAEWGLESSDVKRIATGNYFRGQPTYNCRTQVGSSWIGIYKTISGLRSTAGSSGTVTMSCFVRNNYGTAYNMYTYIGHDFSSTRTIAANSNWQKVQWTVNQSSMNNDYVEFRPYTNNTNRYLEMTMPQVEVNVGNATQWTSTQRNNTGTILPLKGSASIDASSFSYNSQAYPEFDGTDDQVIVNNVGIDNYSEAFSYECVFKAEGTWANSYISNIVGINGSYAGHYGLGKSGTNTVQFVIRDANYKAISATVSDVSTYHHLVGVWDQSNSQMRLYIDGVLATSANSVTKTGSPDSNDLRIGGRAAFGGDNGTYYDGIIPVVKYYKTALTTAEVKTNFLSYSRRFSI
jgi:hypothetical protein